jgi:hypothetical protein
MYNLAEKIKTSTFDNNITLMSSLSSLSRSTCSPKRFSRSFRIRDFRHQAA